MRKSNEKKRVGALAAGTLVAISLLGGCGIASDQQTVQQSTNGMETEYAALDYVTLGTYKEIEVEKIVDGDAEPEEIRRNLINDIWNVVKQNAQIDGYPEKMYEVYDESIGQRFRAEAEAQGVDLERYMSETFGRSYEDYVLEQVESALVLDAVAETEQISLTEQEYRSFAVSYIHDMDCDSLEEAEEMYGKDVVFNYLLTQKIYDFLIEQAVTSEVSYDTYFENKDAVMAE